MSLYVDIEKDLGSFKLKVKFEQENGILGLLGQSGCGKSMTLKCIAGIVKPDKGKIISNGTVFFDSEKKINLSPQKRKVGFLFQNYALFPHMSVKENIQLGIQNLSKEEKDKNLNKAIEENISKNEKKKKDTSYGVTVKGENNLMVRFAKCCNPVPGDDILGYITKGRGVSIHRKDCGNLNSLIKEDPQKVVDVSWGTSKGVAYMAEIQVKTEDKSGILSDVMNILMDSKLPLNALNAKSAKGNLAYINIKIKIDTVEQLKELMKKIKRVPGVLDVYRMNK